MRIKKTFVLSRYFIRRGDCFLNCSQKLGQKREKQICDLLCPHRSLDQFWQQPKQAITSQSLEILFETRQVRDCVWDWGCDHTSSSFIGALKTWFLQGMGVRKCWGGGSTGVIALLWYNMFVFGCPFMVFCGHPKALPIEQLFQTPMKTGKYLFTGGLKRGPCTCGVHVRAVHSRHLNANPSFTHQRTSQLCTTSDLLSTAPLLVRVYFLDPLSSLKI